nr:MAG TPA: hypothetical protein [Caudoviricetes sp.]
MRMRSRVFRKNKQEKMKHYLIDIKKRYQPSRK